MPIHEISIEEYQQRKDAGENFAYIGRSPASAGVHASPASNVPSTVLSLKASSQSTAAREASSYSFAKWAGAAMTAAKQLAAHKAEEDVYASKVAMPGLPPIYRW